MSRGDSTIKVTILGDAKNLVGALNTADTKTGGLIKSGAKVLVAGAAVKKGFDLVNDSLGEADRRGDAIQRIEAKLGDLSAPLIKTSDGFAKIGASSQDMLELEAIYADLATSAGIAAPDIAKSAESMAIGALASAQIHDADPTAIIDAMGKAAGGATRGLKPYGVDLTEAAVAQQAMLDTGKDNPKMLTDTELAAARVTLILAAFNPAIVDATTGSGDLAQKQDELGAKFETVGGKIGTVVEGPLSDVLDFINDEIDAIPGAIAGWGMLGDAIGDFATNLMDPLADLRDLIEDILGALGKLTNFGTEKNLGGGNFSENDIVRAAKNNSERNGLTGATGAR